MDKQLFKIQNFITVVVLFFVMGCASTPSDSDASTDAPSHSITQTSLTGTAENGDQSVVSKKRTPASASVAVLSSLTPVSFTEVWGYVTAGDEGAYKVEYPVTDIGYFGAGLNTFGALTDVPSYKKIKNAPARKHLVVADNGRALTHFCLNPEYPVRKKLIKDIVKAAKPYDGLQIDFELVSRSDKKHYLSFLRQLKKEIGKNKILSVAVPARTKTLKDDTYDYAALNDIADRIIIMAYDEHWSSSAPGPVASIDWCRAIAKYVPTVIDGNKIVMGLPFYGRAWADDNTAGAYRFSSIERLFRGETSKGKPLTGVQLSSVTDSDGVPTFSLTRSVTYTFYFDNAQSLATRLSLYRDMGIGSVAFWRLGQEDTDIWPLLSVR